MGAVVLDGVIAEIVDDAVKGLGYAPKDGVFPRKMELDPLLGGGALQAVHGIFRNAAEIAVLPVRFCPAVVQLGQVDDILHQLCHSGRLAADLPGKGLHVLRAHQAVFQKLGVTGNGMQWGFQLMGHVGGEFLADERRLFDLLPVLLQLLLLVGDPAKQRLHFQIFFLPVILPGVVQVNGVDRLHDHFGDLRCQEHGENQGNENHDADGTGKSQHQCPHGHLDNRKPKHAAVRQPLGAVQLLFCQSAGIAAALAVAFRQSLTDFLPLKVVFHGGRIRRAVIEHRTFGINPGHPVAADFQSIEIRLPGKGNAPGRQQGLGAQLVLLKLGEIVVGQAHNEGQCYEKHRNRHQTNGVENLFIHASTIL